jgi:hypothetical protein
LHAQWVKNGLPDDGSLVALEDTMDRAREECAALVASGYLESDPTAALNLFDPSQRTQARRLAKGASAIAAILGQGHTPERPLVNGAEHRGVMADSPLSRSAEVSSLPSGSRLGELLAMGRRTTIAPSALRPHPQNEDLLQRVGDEQDHVVRADIARNGIARPVIITGERCASPPNTILGGHFRVNMARELGHSTVPVTVLDDFDAAAELAVLAQDNLLDTRRRDLTNAARGRLEKLAYASLKLPIGRPVEDKKSVDSDRLLARPGPPNTTRRRVAEATGATEHGVAARAKIRESPVSTPELRAAVDEKLVSQNAAATWIREQEKSLGGVAAVRALAKSGEVTPALETARAEINVALELAHQGKAAGPSALRPNPATVSDEWVQQRLPLRKIAGRRTCEALIRGQLYRFEVDRDSLFVGLAESPPANPKPEGPDDLS